MSEGSSRNFRSEEGPSKRARKRKAGQQVADEIRVEELRQEALAKEKDSQPTTEATNSYAEVHFSIIYITVENERVSYNS